MLRSCAFRSLGLLVVAVSTVAGQEAPDSVRPAPMVTGRDLAVLGIGTGLAALAQRADLTVRNALRSDGWQRSDLLHGLERTGDVWGGGAALGAGVALWAGGRFAGHATVAASGFRAMEAIAVSGTITSVLKGLVGRARPRVDSLDGWNAQWGRGIREGGDYQAMPSGHTTAAFALAAAVTREVAHRAPRRARLVGITTYGLAGLTAWSRLHSNAHWLSDVTMGATIGIASGWAVTRWHHTRPRNGIDAFFLGPAVSPYVGAAPGGGTRVGATIAWR